MMLNGFHKMFIFSSRASSAALRMTISAGLPLWFRLNRMDSHEMIHDSQIMTLGNPHTFPAVPPWGWRMWFWVKYLEYYWMDIHVRHLQVKISFFPLLNLWPHEKHSLCLVLMSRHYHDNMLNVVNISMLACWHWRWAQSTTAPGYSFT